MHGGSDTTTTVPRADGSDVAAGNTAVDAPAVEDARPRPLATMHGRRVRDEIRARLFDGAVEPEHIGRYEVMRRLGHGAIGVVYACRDPALGREVAIKVMRTAGADTARLRREAQAMAQLADPNVAAVYEVGEHDGGVFVAMELVDGVTLREWQAGRSIHEILGAYLQAGRGLAAAHRVGIVHRDFKPDNVMIGRDPQGAHAYGRVRVLDFGLACAHASDGDATEAVPELPSTMDTTLTATGVTVGTPAYMALEQLRGTDVDARADQFSFAVALFEALYGERPFRGRSLPELAAAIRGGQVRFPAQPRVIAAPLRALLVRALAGDRAQRFTDMDALLAALVRARRPRWLAAAAGGTLIVAAVAVSAASGSADPCANATDPLDGAWSRAIAGKTRDALRERGARDAAAEARIAELDDRAQQWRNEALAVCRSEGDELDLRRTCLDDVRAMITTTAEVLAASGATVDAPMLTLTSCHDLRRGGRIPSQVPTRHLVAAMEIRAAIDRAVQEGADGNYAAVLAVITPAVALAREIEDPALLAESLLLFAATQSLRGDHADAERLAKEAYEVALAGGADRLALRAAATLVEMVGYEQRRRDDGEQWARAGESIAARLPPDDEMTTDLMLNRGLMRLELGDHELARADLEAALLRYGDDEKRLPVLSNLAHLAMIDGSTERALELLATQIAVIERLRGKTHPDLVTPLVNRSVVHSSRERWPDARADLDRATAICAERDLVSLLPRVQRNLADLAYDEGRFGDARAGIEGAIGDLAREHGEQHPLVYSAKILRASVLIELAELETARTVLHDVLASAEAKVGTEADVVGGALLELARLEVSAGDYDAAWRSLERAQPLTTNDLAASVAWFSRSAQVLIGKGGPELSIEGLEKLRETAVGAPTLTTAELELTLARAHAAAGHPAAQYVPLAEAARDRWRARGGDWEERARAVDAWLAEQR